MKAPGASLPLAVGATPTLDVPYLWNVCYGYCAVWAVLRTSVLSSSCCSLWQCVVV